MSPEQIIQKVGSLIDAWCERRCLNALRSILQAWPLYMGLTDEWMSLYDSLKHIRASIKEELTPQELELVHELEVEVDKIVRKVVKDL